jgi:hypothetical protein
MLNAKTLTDTLSRMGLPELYNYATLHKNDPYVVSMALSIANQKKQADVAKAGRAGMVQQPKVVDQALAQISPTHQMAQAMPEDLGIGQLPAPNMQRMAEGGIVAFDEGGEVRHFDGVSGPSYVGRPTGGLLGDIPGYVPGATSFGIPQPGIEDPNSLTTWEKLKRWNERGIAEEKLRQVNAARAQAGLAPIAQTGSPPVTASAEGIQTLAKPPATSPSPTPTVAPGGLGKRTPPPVTTPPAATAAARPTTSQQGIASLGTDPAALVKEMDTLRGNAPTTTPFDASIDALTQANVKSAEDQKAQFESDIEKLGPAFKDREERLGKRKEKLDAQEDRLPYMALMEAGLNIMAGTSPNALTNIGAGSAVGLKSYVAGVDKLMDARDKLDDAYGKIEEYRRTEDSMNNKERRAFMKEINTAKTDGMKMGIQALQDEWKLNRKDASEMFTALEKNRSTVFSEQQQNLRNQVSAGATVESAKIHAKGSLDAAKLTAETYKLPMLYKAVEDSVDKKLAADINYKTADEATKTIMRDAELRKRLLATPGMAQFVPQDATGGGGGGLKYNPQTGKIE